MDYEKKYNEALERARKIHDEIVNNEIIGFPEQITDIFPELRESEDERVIRTLYHLVKDHDWLNGATKEEVFAWLEKQKECLADNGKTSASEDERIRKGLIEALKASKTVGELKFVLPYPTREECIAYLEKQKEQKPTEDKYQQELEATDRWQEGYEAGYNAASKPAEWSEEDENMLWNIISIVGQSKSIRADEMLNWLKSLRLQPNPIVAVDAEQLLKILPKRQVWSEDDEQYLLVCKNALHKYQRSDQWDANIISKWLDEKLKSLRLSWKPSEEQMRALNKVVNGEVLLTTQHESLESLYEQLKKL